MGLFDSLTEALRGPIGQMLEQEAATVLPDILSKTNFGGLQGIVDQLQQAGLGDHVEAWIKGTEAPSLSPDLIEAALSSEQVKELAQHFGVDPSLVGTLLAQHLPGAVAQGAQNGLVSAASG